MSLARIVILVRPEDNFAGMPYMIEGLIEIWRAQGREVIIHEGLANAPAADVAVLHVDLTVIPEPYLALARTYARAVNVQVTDISKQRISPGIVKRGDGYSGPVIVKTDCNTAGENEVKVALQTGGAARLVHRLRGLLPWYCRAYLRRYRIYDAVSEVPLGVWWNRDLVVERFRPERDGELYCLRTWVFFGDCETNSISYSKEPVIKSRVVIRREPLDEVPPELRDVRRKLGFDYGKFDYAVVNGRVVLYDVNRTPGAGRLVNQQASQNRSVVLAAGLASFETV